MTYKNALLKQTTSIDILSYINNLPDDLKYYLATFIIGASSYKNAVQVICSDAKKFLSSPNFYNSNKFHHKINRILYYKNSDNPNYLPTGDDINLLKHDIWTRLMDKKNKKSVWNLANLNGTIYVKICNQKKDKYKKTFVAVCNGKYSDEMFYYNIDAIENMYRRNIKRDHPKHPHAKVNNSYRLVHQGFTEIRINKYCTIRQNEYEKNSNPDDYCFEVPFSIGSYSVVVALLDILREIPKE